MKYKVGEQVRIIKNTNKDNYYDGYIGKVGYIYKIDNSRYPYEVFEKSDGKGEDYHWWKEEELEPAVKTLHNLEVGDVIVKGSCKRTVLKKANVYIMSEINSKEEDSDFTAKQLKLCGYEPFIEEEDDDKTEEAMKLLKDKGYKIIKQ